MLYTMPSPLRVKGTLIVSEDSNPSDFANLKVMLNSYLKVILSIYTLQIKNTSMILSAVYTCQKQFLTSSLKEWNLTDPGIHITYCRKCNENLELLLIYKNVAEDLIVSWTFALY